MPPRKSTSSIPPTDNEDAGSPTNAAAAGTQMTEQQFKAQSDGVSVEDLLLPRSVTQRLAKSVLPPDTAIQKDALLAIQKAATVFVSYLSSHANEATLKRTLAPSDVLDALSELEFDSFRPQLERELDAHTEALADKKKALKDRKAATAQTEAKDGDEEAAVIPAAAEEKKDVTTTTTSSTIKGNKRIKRDSTGNEKIGNSPNDETEVDEDETEEEDVEDEEDEDEEVGEEEDENEDDETQDAEDLDRVEDLDGKMQAEYDDSGSDDEDTGPAAQLRSNMGFG